MLRNVNSCDGWIFHRRVIERTNVEFRSWEAGMSPVLFSGVGHFLNCSFQVLKSMLARENVKECIYLIGLVISNPLVLYITALQEIEVRV